VETWKTHIGLVEKEKKGQPEHVWNIPQGKNQTKEEPERRKLTQRTTQDLNHHDGGHGPEGKKRYLTRRGMTEKGRKGFQGENENTKEIGIEISAKKEQTVTWNI